MKRVPPAPAIRVAEQNDAPVRGTGRYVLYWMVANRRARHNFALQHALHLAQDLQVPLLVFEPLRVGYRWASHRLHRFVLDGMRDNLARVQGRGVTYLPYVEPEPGAGRGLLTELAEHARVVVTDESPTFFLPRMLAAAGERLSVRLLSVDSCGVVPLRATERAWPTAYAFRRHLQRTLPDYLGARPLADPLAGYDLGAAPPPPAVRERWSFATDEELEGVDLHSLPIDASVPPVPDAGGAIHGERVLDEFLAARLDRYEERNQPDMDAASGLSPWLHFGHVSAHEVVGRVLDDDGWTPDRAARDARGKRAGWWGASPFVESFLDEVITWRELGFAWAHHRPHDYDRFASLPEWARRTLAEHARDEREHLYSLDDLENARTHDEVWNAAQRELRATGRVHNYLRMLWGKNVLAWTRTPEEAARVLIELNNKWATDGRDPNSYTGIFWVLGRHDRAWGPERPVFGKIRYMTSSNTKRKLKLKRYLERWSGQPSLL